MSYRHLSIERRGPIAIVTFNRPERANALHYAHLAEIEQAALSFRDGGVFDSDRWRAALVHTGYRAALVASGDVLGAFEHIVRQDRRLAAAAAIPDDLMRAARASAEVVEMINFALGDELAALNRRLGLD